MIHIQEATSISIFAPVASGKTHLMRKLMEPYRRVLWHDTTFEVDFSDKTFEHFFKPSQLVERFRQRSDYRIAYHPSTSDIVQEFDLVSRLYWQEDFSRWLVIDEVHEYANSMTLDSMFRYARKRLLGIVCASQRIADVPKVVTTNSRMIVLFFTPESRDHVAIRDRFGESVEEQVKQLRPLLYDDTSKVTKQYPECIVYRRGQPIEKYDLSPSKDISTHGNESGTSQETNTDTGTPAV